MCRDCDAWVAWRGESGGSAWATIGRDRSCTGRSRHSTRSANEPSTARSSTGRSGTARSWPIPAGIGGPEPGPAGHVRQGDRSGVALYVQVRDIRASLARAAELGGTVIAEPFDIPGGPTLAPITDPEGNPVMLVQQ